MFLSKAAQKAPRFAPLFLLMARAGLRLVEALAPQWQDLDFRAREIRVARAFSEGEIETPNAGHGRTVDMSQQLTQALLVLQAERRTETLRRGWREVPAWVFCSLEGTPLDEANVRRAFNAALKEAALPLHFTPHGLRHTFASLLLQDGVSPAYVQRQLGHASIQLTVDTYGKWLPMGNKSAVDRLDFPGSATESEQSGSKVVANGGGTRMVGTGTPEKGWSRRSDLNRGPADYESAALPTELRRLRRVSVVKSPPLGKPFCAVP